MAEKIIPDVEAIKKVESKSPTLPLDEKYRLVQADTLIRLAKAETMEELRRMAEVGTLDDLIRVHNAKMRRIQRIKPF